MKNKTIYIIGNPMLEYDNIPIKLLAKLKKQFPEIDFIEIDPNENLKPIDKKLIIIDTVEGIEKVTLISNIEVIMTDSIYSAHDFDLAYNLKLLSKLGELKEFLIYGIPMNYDKNKAYEELIKLI